METEINDLIFNQVCEITDSAKNEVIYVRAEKPDYKKEISFSSGSKEVVFTLSNITYIKKSQDSIIIYQAEEPSYVADFEFEKLEAYINQPNFVRCHESFIVNADYIKEISIAERSVIILIGNEAIPCAANRLKKIKDSLKSAYINIYTSNN